MRLFLAAVLFMVSGNLFAQCFQKVSAGELHFIAISQNGSLWAWGDNGSRQLGDGTIIDRPQPVLISAANWASVSAGLAHSVAIKADGTLWTWGSDNNQQLGNSSGGNSATPLQIGTDSNWKEAAAGERGTVAIKTDGTLWAWGSNNNGYLGNGQTNSYESSVPIQIGTATNWNHIAGNDGRSCLAIKLDGTLWAWGLNQSGQLGNGTTTDSYTPIQIGTDTNWKWIDCGSRLSFAMKTDNTLWAWGFCNSGFSLNSNQPLQIGTDSNWETVSVKKYEGTQYVLMTKTNGTLWGWGNDDFQQLGNGTAGDYTNPAQIGTAINWVDAFAGYQQSSGVKSDGTFWVWGTTNLVGDGSTPVSIPTVYNCSALGVAEHVKNSLMIYPNPVTDRLYISEMEILSAVVYDINGRKYTLPFDRQTKSIDVTKLSAGVYIVTTETESGKQNTRFIKK